MEDNLHQRGLQIVCIDQKKKQKKIEKWKSTSMEDKLNSWNAESVIKSLTGPQKQQLSLGEMFEGDFEYMCGKTFPPMSIVMVGGGPPPSVRRRE